MPRVVVVALDSPPPPPCPLGSCTNIHCRCRPSTTASSSSSTRRHSSSSSSFTITTFLGAIASPLLFLFLFFSAYVFHQLPTVDLMPLKNYRVHLIRPPEGEWLSLLNLRVVFQTPDVVDVEGEEAAAIVEEKEEPMDFDDDDDTWTVIQLPDPIEWHTRNWTARIGKAWHSQEEKVEAIDSYENLTITTTTTEKTTKMPEEVVPKKKQKVEEENEKVGLQATGKEVPELSLLRDILPWIPHMLRRHHRVHKPKKKGKARMHLEQILMGTTAMASTTGTTEMLTDEETIETTDETTGGNVTDYTSMAENNTALALENATESPPPLEPINEEELALNLHKDSLHRNESTLRQLLTRNLTISQANGDEKAVDMSREMYRDLGGSFILPLLKETKYDNRSIPLVFPDEPLRVFISLEILHLGNFDNFQMEYELDVLFHLQWYDVRLANNFTKSVRIKEQQIIDKIWKPDAMFFNSKYSFFHLVSFPNFRMRIQPDGHITYTSRITLLPDCQMNFCNFPHDTQRCGLLISSIAHPTSMLKLLWDGEQPIAFAKKVSLPDLRIKNIGMEECRIGGKLIPSSCLTLSFSLQRESARYVAEKYLPSTLAMIFSWVAPYVPYNYEEVRIITPITVLLTLVQMEKGNQEVITSYLTSLDIWFVVIKAFTVLSLVESLTVMAYIKRARAVEKQAQRASSEYQKELLQAEARRIVNVYHQLDHFARVFSPVAFICFLMYYLAFIVQRNEQECKE